MSKFEDSRRKTITVIDAWDSSQTGHYVSCRNRRCRCRQLCCSCLSKQCRLRLWHVILLLLIEAIIIIPIGIVVAMFGPFNTIPRYSGSEAEVTTTEPYKGTTRQPLTAAKQTTLPNTTTASAPSEKTLLECEVAIVGGGTAGLLMAHQLLLSNNETNVCVFEKENRLGGKIFDHRFPEVPDVTVGLGEWHIHGGNDVERALVQQLSVHAEKWNKHVYRVEACGVYANSFDSLKSKAYPSLLDRPPTNNNTVVKTAEIIANRGTNEFSTARKFLSSCLSPAGAKLMEGTYGFTGGYMQAINPKSYQTYLKEAVADRWAKDYDARPVRGMSEIIEKLGLKVRSFHGKIYLQELVTSLCKEGNKFVLQTTNLIVQANKTVLTAGPAAIRKITGDVVQNVINHVIFKSIVSVPAFHGAAIYQTAWWNDSIAVQRNNSLEPLQMFASSSNCLGITLPYRETGPNGRAVLHTIANNGGCSDKWGSLLEISKDAVDKEMKRALEYKFQRTILEEPLDTVYKYWEEGFWYFQKPGANFSLSEIRHWAKRPLPGNDVFLVGKAFYNFGGWLQDSILSTNEALKEGWNFTLSWLPY